MTHIYVGNLTIIGSDIGLSPDRRQAIIWTNAGILLIGPLGINFNEIFFGVQTFSFKKIHLKMSSGKRWPFCLGLNVLRIDSVKQNCDKKIAFYHEENRGSISPMVVIVKISCQHSSVVLNSLNIGSVNGLVPLDNKPLPESTKQIFFVFC